MKILDKKNVGFCLRFFEYADHLLPSLLLMKSLDSFPKVAENYLKEHKIKTPHFKY